MHPHLQGDPEMLHSHAAMPRAARPTDHFLHVQLGPRTLAGTLAAGVLGAVVTTVATVQQGPPVASRYLAWARHQLNLTIEQTIGTWFSSVLFLAAALAAGLCFLLEEEERQTGAASRLRYGWLAVGAIFVLLSLDELGSLHERIGRIQSLNVFGIPGTEWVGVLAVPIAGVALYLGIFALARARRHTGAALLFLLGVACLVSIPFQEELEMVMRGSVGADADYRRPLGFRLLEEGVELAGSLCFLAAGLVFALATSRRLRTRRGRSGTGIESHLAIGRAFERTEVALLAALVASALVLELLVRTALPAVPHHGEPINWFASTAAILAALGCLQLRAESGDAAAVPRHARGALLALAVHAALVALDSGSSFALSRDFFAGSPRLELAVRAAAGSAGALLAGWATTVLPRRLRPALLALAGGLALASFLDAFWAPAVLFAGYVTLCLALVGSKSHDLPPHDDTESIAAR